MANAPTTDIGRPDFTWGTYGQGLLSDWWETTADLIWPQSVVTYGRMRMDPQLKAVLAAYIYPLMRATWALDPDGCKTEVVQRVSDALGVMILGEEDKGAGPARRSGVIFHKHLRQALNYLIYGHMPFERRYKQLADGFMQLVNLGERAPWTLAMINVNPDGTLNTVEQVTQREPIPASHLVWYANNQIGSNWAGESLIRPAFGAWLLKHEGWRVEATSIRRFGMGVPQVTAPPGASAQMVAQAQLLASQIRAGDQSGVGMPAGYQAQLMGITGSIPDGLSWIKYLDVVMAKMALVGLIELGQSDHGSRALGETFLDLFQLALQGVADEIATTVTTGSPGVPGIITDLVDQNWGTPDKPEAAPRLVCTDVGQNYELSAQAIQALTLSGAITPDAGLDEWIRKTWRMPKRTDKWTPSSRGLPAGFGVSQKDEAALDRGQGAFNPGGSPGQGGGGSLPSPPSPGGSGGSGQGGGSGAGSAAPSSSTTGGGSSTSSNASAPPPFTGSALQRNYLAASHWEPDRHQNEWDEALAHLLLQYRNIFSAQQTNLVDQVLTALERGDTQIQLTAPPTGEAASMVQQAMENLALRAARAMIEEAAAQGVTINIDDVRIDTDRLGGVAASRVGVSASTLQQQATIKALQLYGPTPSGYVAAADEVSRFLKGLSDRATRDQLGAALTAAQNVGRTAVLEAAPEGGPNVTYVAAEWLDQNTCENCKHEDGHEYLTLEEAEAAYPTGGFKDCLGLMRCRGTIIAVWGDESTTTEAERAALPVAAAFDPAEPRDKDGKWLGGVEHDADKLLKEPRTSKGRLAAQTPSQFIHPDTGHKMGKTEIGDTYEALFRAKGAHLLVKHYGGDYRVISGEAKEGGGRGARNTPLDFALDHLFGGELKTLNARAANQKTAIKAEEVARKEAAVKDAGLKPLLVVQVVNPETGRVEVYAYPAFASKATTKMQHLGGYDYTAGDFTAAQEATGHAGKAAQRAREQKLAGSAQEAGREPPDDPPVDPEPQPGDTVIELRDGVPWISVQGKTAARDNTDDGTWVFDAELGLRRDVTAGFDPDELRDPHTGKWIRDPEGKFLDEAAKALKFQQRVSHNGHVIDRTKAGYTVKLKTGERQHYDKAEHAAQAARLGRHLSAGDLGKGAGGGGHPKPDRGPLPAKPGVGDIVGFKDGKGNVHAGVVTKISADGKSAEVHHGPGNKLVSQVPLDQLAVVRQPAPSKGDKLLNGLAEKHGLLTRVNHFGSGDQATTSTYLHRQPGSNFTDKQRGYGGRLLRHSSDHPNDYFTESGAKLTPEEASKFIEAHKQHPEWGDQALINVVRRGEPKPPGPKPPEPKPAGPPSWNAVGSDWHYGSVGGKDYTLHYAKGGGWDVYQGKHPGKGTLPPQPLHHAKNAKEAKAWAEQHAAGGVTAPEPKPAEPKPAAPEPPKPTTVGRQVHIPGLPPGFTAHELPGTDHGGKPGIQILDSKGAKVARLEYHNYVGRTRTDRVAHKTEGYTYTLNNPDVLAHHAALRQEALRSGASYVPPLKLGQIDPALSRPRNQTAVKAIEHHQEYARHMQLSSIKPVAEFPAPPKAVITQGTPAADKASFAASAAWIHGNVHPNAQAAVRQIYGADSKWNATSVERSSSWLGVMKWEGGMGLTPATANGIADAFHPDPTHVVTDKGEGIRTLWHEVHHAIGAKQYSKGGMPEAGDYATRSGHAYEEGFTELGAHLTMGEFLKANGIADRPMQSGSDLTPAGRDAKTNLRMELNRAAQRAAARSFALNQKNTLTDAEVTQRTRAGRAQLLANQAKAAVDEMAPDHQARVAQALQALSAAGLTEYNGNIAMYARDLARGHAPNTTLGQHFEKTVTPGEMSGKQVGSGAIVAYRELVYKAYNFEDAIAALEAKRDGQSSTLASRFERVKELAKAVNAKSGPYKRNVMVAQLLTALELSPEAFTIVTYRGRPMKLAEALSEAISDNYSRSENPMGSLLSLLRQMQNRGEIPVGRVGFTVPA